jgi:hypothetical protein
VVGAFVIARIARTVDRISDVGLGTEIAVLDLEVVAQIVSVDIAINH